MSYIPNVREKITTNPWTGEQEENAYYEGNLKDEYNIAVVRGFDFCVEESIENFFDNLDNYKLEFADAEPPLPSLELLDRQNPGFINMLKECILDWSEKWRDELVVSMLDSEFAEK